MALNACCRFTRCVLGAVGNGNGAVRELVSRARCLHLHAGLGTDVWRRTFSSVDQAAGSVDYEQVKKLLVTRAGVVIDVREPWELREYGSIPGSVNVPLGQVSAALQLKPVEFKEKYGGELPLADQHLVFICLAGVRSLKAVEAAQGLGYCNVQHYPGGWQDWAEHEILQVYSVTHRDG